MATREELMTALRNADAAGDVESAKRIAAMVPSESAAPAPKSALPKSNYGLTENPGVVEQFLGGAKHAWDRSAAALQAGAGKLGLPTGESLEPLVKQGKQFVEETGPASTVGNIGGELLMTAAPGAGAFKLATALPRVARMGRYGQAMVGGGAAGAAGETMMGGSPLEGAGYGAVLGPAGTAVGNLASGTVRGARRLFSGADDATTRYLRELSTDPTADAAALRALRGEVAGEMPTSGMAATVDPRMQYLAAIERQTAARATGGRHFARTQANEAARMAPLENIAAPGRTTFPARQSPAELARSQGTTPMYARADEDRILLNPELEALVAGRQIQPAANRADIRFGQEQTNAFVGGRPVPAGAVARNEPNMQRDSLTNSFINGPPSSVVPNRSVRDLQTLKEQLNVSIDSAMRQGKMEDVRRLSQARNQLNERMRTQSPAYREATDAYRALSQPQNAAEIAQVYANALRDQGVTGLVSARNNTARTLKRADQSSRFQHEGEVLTPQQLQDVNAVTRSAQRQADLNAIPDVRLPRQISAAEELEQGIPGLLNRPIAIAKKALQRLGSHTDEQVRTIIDEASLNPQRMADLLERIPASERQNFIDAVRAANPRGAITGTITGQIGQE
jgi:hypothetical protein